MDVKTQAVEQFLFKQLEEIAPGKYTLQGVLQSFKSKLRFPCNHLKGGGRSRSLGTMGKDYNFSIFTFPTGVTEVKCLYNCGLKIRSDQGLTSSFNELYDLPSSNSKASAEWSGKRNDPGPVPTYSDEYRRRLRESTDTFLSVLLCGVESGRIQPGDVVLGGKFPHPDPVEAPDSIIEREMLQAHQKMNKKSELKTTKIKSRRKQSKTKSRRKAG